ncbi:F0F1 ATP synthase subunit B [Marivibrio halodurans]|uniref:ATP synthase subunit b n=1 Tax=Marivibrio halodurans TaxID=2039722 RepID=A0A8J7V0A6_9PROT|nr:F0F1 ATP synthase subunit B [Marivibrio halodurans]MBP5856591.1 F0F1 ATP synthase subunit B [Marivibrio halodurans]
MDALLQNTTFWVGVSFVGFVILAYVKGRGPIREAVHGRIDRIRAEIEQAEQLKEEANKQLADAKKKQREAEDQAEKIVENAKKEAKALKKEADERLADFIKRREQQAEDKIAQAEANAIREVRGKAVDMAIDAAGIVIGDQMKGAAGTKVMDDAIKSVSTRLN